MAEIGPDGKYININRHRRPSARQIKTLQFIQQGYSVAKSMRMAGYSTASAHQSQKFLRRQVVKDTLLQMPEEFNKVGITKRYVAQRLRGLFEATKIHTSHTEPDREVPDNMVRLKAIDTWHNFMKENQNQMGGTTRKLTIEEFIGGPENKGIETDDSDGDEERSGSDEERGGEE